MVQMPIIINGEEALTATESAEYLHVSGATFVKFQKQFKLKAYTRPGAGQRKFFLKKDLEPIKQYHPIEGDENKQ